MMIKSDLVKADFKAKIRTGSYSDRSFPSQRSSAFLERLLEETTSRNENGCVNQDWQFDFVCPVVLNRFRQAQSKYHT